MIPNPDPIKASEIALVGTLFCFCAGGEASVSSNEPNIAALSVDTNIAEGVAVGVGVGVGVLVGVGVGLGFGVGVAVEVGAGVGVGVGDGVGVGPVIAIVVSVDHVGEPQLPVYLPILNK